jgi:hypothetical protein
MLHGHRLRNSTSSEAHRDDTFEGLVSDLKEHEGKHGPTNQVEQWKDFVYEAGLELNVHYGMGSEE